MWHWFECRTAIAARCGCGGRGHADWSNPETISVSQPMSATIVQSLFDGVRVLGPLQYALVEAVRALVRETVRAAVEEVKYGRIRFISGVPFCVEG